MSGDVIFDQCLVLNYDPTVAALSGAGMLAVLASDSVALGQQWLRR